MEMNKFTAGFGRLDVTPPLGVFIGGGWNARYGQGVLDPLYVNAVAFGDGEQSAVLLVLDNLGLYGITGETWHHQVAEKLSLAPGSVIIACTHSHTTPSVGTDELYDKWLFRRLCDAATIALNDRKPVTDVKWVEERAEGMAYVRRYKLKDGTVMTNPAGSYLDLIVDFANENDDTMRVVRIQREEGEEIALVNFQAHPDNIGGDWYSADYPGAFRNKVEQLRENTKCIFLDGCQGQMVIDYRAPGKPKKPASHEKATTYGHKLAEMAAAMFDHTVSTGMTGMSFGQKAVDLKTKRDPARVPEAERVIALHEAGKDLEIHPMQKIANYILSESRQLVRLEKNKQDYKPTAVSGITFCGLALVGMPGEPFNEVGKQVRGNSKFPATCLMCNANGAYGYFPTAEGHDQGGYESYNTPYIKGTAEQLADAADELLKEL